MAQMVFPESAGDRTMSSFYASTSAGVNNIMLSRLNEMIEHNIQQNVQQNVQQSDIWNKDTEKEVPMSGMSGWGQTELPSTCSEQRPAEGFKDLGLPEDYYRGEEDRMQPREPVLCQLSSQFQSSDPDSNFATDSGFVAAEFSSDLEDCSDYILSADNATRNQVCPRKKICPAKTPFHLMTYVQLVAYIKIILANSSEMLPLQLLHHVQDHLREEERTEFEKLWPMILHSVSSEQLQKLADLAEIELPPCMKVIQDPQTEEQDDGANEDNHFPPSMEMTHDEQPTRCGDGAKEGNYLPPCVELFQWDDGGRQDVPLAPCKEIIQYAQIERRDGEARRDNHLAPCMEIFQYQQTDQQIERWDGEAKEDNHLTGLVPYVGNVGNAIVAYDGSFFPLRKRKPRPKVYLDTETIRVWKLLMGKTEPTENDSDIDNELKWKQERLLMQEQAEGFIRRMHLIQGK
jgi:hypothetical protein